MTLGGLWPFRDPRISIASSHTVCRLATYLKGGEDGEGVGCAEAAKKL